LYTLETDLVYDTSSTIDNTYYFRNVSSSTKYLIENRQEGNTFDSYLPHVKQEMDGGILIWKIGSNALGSGTNVIAADNDYTDSEESQAEDIFRPDGNYPYHTISDYSTPANLKLDGNFTHFALDSFYTNADAIPIRFITNYWAGTITSNTTWNDSTYVGGDISIPSGVTLTLGSTAVVDLFANLCLTGGTLVRQTGCEIRPDLRLMNNIF